MTRFKRPVRTTRQPVLDINIIATASTIVLVLLAFPVVAAAAGESMEMGWFKLGMGLFGGLAMFLFGMDLMSDGLQAADGDTLKDLLAKLSKNRVMGASRPPAGSRR